jgi:hypothetical protein
MKRAIILTALLCLGAVACGNKAEPLEQVPEQYEEENKWYDERISMEPEKEENIKDEKSSQDGED